MCGVRQVEAGRVIISFLEICLCCKVKDLEKMIPHTVNSYKPLLHVQIYFAVYCITLPLSLCFILVFIFKVIGSSLNAFYFTEEYLSLSQVW